MFTLLKRWVREDKAVAAIEAGLLFPILGAILCGMIDVGVGLVANQKILNASQTIADLLAREDDITDEEMQEAVIAGRLSLQPYTTATFGADVVGIRFLNAAMTPTEQWRDTFNMQPNFDVLAGSAGLGERDEGVIAVTVRYNYQPFFSHIILETVEMEEISYVRGRKGLFVTRNAEEA